MKYWIFTINEPTFYGPMYFRIINESIQKPAGVIHLNRKTTLKDLKYFYKFWGLKAFIYITLKTISHKILRKQDVKKVTLKNNIPYFQIDNLEELNDIFKGEDPGFILSSIPNKVSLDLLNLTSYGWVNTHCGPLPKYAGQDAPFWCMLNGEEKLTVTIHKMNEHYDEGEIYKQRSINNCGIYFRNLFQLLDLAADEHIQLLSKEFSVDMIKNDVAQGFFKKKPKAQRGKAFRNSGGKFI